jgi:hypothetical protein
MTACPSDDALCALLERALDDDEVARVTEHLDVCSSCREVVVAAVRGGIVALKPFRNLTIRGWLVHSR